MATSCFYCLKPSETSICQACASALAALKEALMKTNLDATTANRKAQITFHKQRDVLIKKSKAQRGQMYSGGGTPAKGDGLAHK